MFLEKRSNIGRLKVRGESTFRKRKLIRVVMGLIKTSIQDLSRKVGMMSNTQVESED